VIERVSDEIGEGYAKIDSVFMPCFHWFVATQAWRDLFRRSD
jgi:hypothetical protein